MGILISLFSILLVVVLALLILILYREIRQQRQTKNRTFPIKSLNLAYKQVKKDTGKTATQSVPSHLEKQLLSMVGGNRDAAQRLVANIQQKNRDRDQAWCWQKAIADLERDRR